MIDADPEISLPSAGRGAAGTLITPALFLPASPPAVREKRGVVCLEKNGIRCAGAGV